MIDLNLAKWIGIKVTELLGTWLHQMQIHPEMIQYAADAIADYMQQYRAGRAVDRLGAAAGMYDAIDRAHRDNKSKDKRNISCKKGCSFCCHIEVRITNDEADLILHHCKESNIRINFSYLENQALLPTKERPLSKYSACTFLKNNQCSIYEVRPIACRKHYVCSPPIECDAKKYPGRKIGKFFDLNTELIASAALSETENDQMAIMLLKSKSRINEPI